MNTIYVLHNLYISGTHVALYLQALTFCPVFPYVSFAPPFDVCLSAVLNSLIGSFFVTLYDLLFTFCGVCCLF